MRQAASYIAAAVLAVGLLLSPSAEALNGFTDVPPDAYYTTAVDWLVDQGITTGTTPTTYSPGDPVTRAQMAAFLWRFAGEPDTDSKSPFTDVPPDAYYTTAVDWLVDQGITTGTTPTTYSPGDPVTRAQMAAFLWRFAGEPDTDSESPFTDVPPDAYYTTAVDWLVDQGITTGTTPTTYSPGDPVTRAQMAAFLWRFAGEPAVGDPGFNRSPQPSAPIRAAFLYPWFPQAWEQGGVSPFTQFTPSLGLYDSADPATIDRQMQLAKDAHLEAFISSWWGQGHHTDTALASILDRVPSSPHPSMKLAIYYEAEGESDPSPATIAADLDYLSDRYFSDPSYLRVNGKPVVFVWADSGDGPDMAQRWKQAKADFGKDLYVVLKVYSGFEDDPNQPDSWHQYGPSTPYSEHLPYSATVSPGFWHALDSSPRLGRDPDRFRSDVEQMTASGAFWHLITTWNEWGEGTSIEPADEFGETYIDILTEVVPDPPAPPPPSGGGDVTFTAAGDIGAGDRTDRVLAALVAEGAEFHLAVGDMSYSERSPESSWCTYVKDVMGSTYPFQLLVGNHEDDDRVDGFIRNFTECLPDRMGSSGDYGVEYYFDSGPLRVIMVAADLSVDGRDYDYNTGARRDWLLARIDEAEADGRWTVVGTHKNCISTGTKSCEIGESMMNDMIAHGVDLILQGHDHNYQRSHQLRCVDADTVTAGCLADTDSSFEAEAGTVVAVTGWVGRSGSDVDPGDSEAGYFAVIAGPNTPGYSMGYLTVSASDTVLSGTWTSVDGTGTDSFVIRR